MLLSNAKKFWVWLVVSSADPTQVATTVQGLFSMAIVQAIFTTVLPLIGVHPTFTLNVLGTDAYSFVYSALSIISALVTAYGAIRKIWASLTGTNAAMAAFRASHGR